MIDADAAKPDKQLKMEALFTKSDKAPAGQAKAGPSKRKPAAPTKRVPKTPQQAQREQQAEHAEHAQPAEAAAAVGRTSKRSMAAAAAAAEAVAAAAAAAGDTSSGGGAMHEEEEGRSARDARVQARAEHLHPTQLGSPAAPRGSKHRRGGVATDGDQSVSHEVRWLRLGQHNHGWRCKGLHNQHCSIRAVSLIAFACHSTLHVRSLCSSQCDKYIYRW